MSALLLLLACGTPPTGTTDPPTDTDASTDTDTCASVDLTGAPIDCVDLQPLWCDHELELLDSIVECCECDESLCMRPNCDDPPPPEFPPDTGPALSFEGGLTGGLLPIPQNLWVGPDPDGLLRMTGGDIQGTQPLPCTRSLNTLVCGDHVASGLPFSLFDLRLTDADGDGVADGGIVRAMARIDGDAVSTYSDFEADTTGLSTDFGTNELVPTDAIEVQLREPIDPDSVPAMLDGVGPWELLLANDDVALGARVFGIADWGSTVTMDGLTDVAGNPMVVTPGTVVANPGLANDNLDFELDGVGWSSAQASLRNDEVISASSGQYSAYMWQNESIVGELQIPVDTPILSFDWTRDLSFSPSAATMTFTVVTPSGRTTLWSQDPSDPPGVDGDWATASVDLSEWAGETVFVRFDVTSDLYPPDGSLQNYTWVPAPQTWIGIGFDNLQLSSP